MAWALVSGSNQAPLGHVQQATTSRLQVDDFAESPPPPPSDDRPVVSWKDDGGSCSQALPPAPNTVVRFGRRRRSRDVGIWRQIGNDRRDRGRR
jgi:hypothetical protein